MNSISKLIVLVFIVSGAIGCASAEKYCQEHQASFGSFEKCMADRRERMRSFQQAMRDSTQNRPQISAYQVPTKSRTNCHTKSDGMGGYDTECR